MRAGGIGITLDTIAYNTGLGFLPQPSQNSRKTQRGAAGSWHRLRMRAAPFAGGMNP